MLLRYNIIQKCVNHNIFPKTKNIFFKQLNSSFSSSGHASGGVEWHGTTIIAVKKNGQVAMAGDGQVSAGSTV
jgi:hypothetical protein